MPRAAAEHLRSAGWEVAHVGELGLATAKDAEILDAARQLGACVVTMDADFHGLLAISGADSPSVIRLRIQGIQARAFADMLLRLAPQFEQAATSGALITIDERTVRLHRLPLTRKPKVEP